MAAAVAPRGAKGHGGGSGGRGLTRSQQARVRERTAERVCDGKQQIHNFNAAGLMELEGVS